MGCLHCLTSTFKSYRERVAVVAAGAVDQVSSSFLGGFSVSGWQHAVTICRVRWRALVRLRGDTSVVASDLSNYIHAWVASQVVTDRGLRRTA